MRPTLGIEIPLAFRKWLTKEELFKPGIDFAFFTVTGTTGFAATNAIMVLDITVNLQKNIIANFQDGSVGARLREKNGGYLDYIPEYQIPDSKKFGVWPPKYGGQDRFFNEITQDPTIDYDPFDPNTVAPADDPDNPTYFPPLPPFTPDHFDLVDTPNEPKLQHDLDLPPAPADLDQHSIRDISSFAAPKKDLPPPPAPPMPAQASLFQTVRAPGHQYMPKSSPFQSERYQRNPDATRKRRYEHPIDNPDMKRTQ